MNNLGILTALFTEPRKAFDSLAERPRFWFPLLLGIAVALALVGWYYSIVDIDWLIDQQLRASPRSAQMTDEQRAQAAQFMSRGTLMGLSLVAAILLSVLVRSVEAAYYLLAGKIVNVQRSFKQWFSLACWTGMPQVVSALPAFLTLATTSNTQIGQDELSPLSLNALLFHRGIADSGYALLSYINVLHIASLLLLVIGVHQWSKRSWSFSAIFALLPPVLIFGTWALITLGRA
jgi:hypothetical protein